MGTGTEIQSASRPRQFVTQEVAITFGGQGHPEDELLSGLVDVAEPQTVDADVRSLTRHRVDAVRTHRLQSVPWRVAAKHGAGRRKLLLRRRRKHDNNCYVVYRVPR